MSVDANPAFGETERQIKSGELGQSGGVRRHGHRFSTDLFIIERDGKRNLHRSVFAVVVHTGNQTATIGAGKTRLVDAHAVDTHICPVLDREINGFRFHVSSNDTFAARTVPPVSLKIRNNNQLPLIPGKFTQHAVGQGECLVKPCGFKGWFYRVERGLQRILVGCGPRNERSVLVERNKRHAVARA